MNKLRHLIIEGPDGSGKDTLIGDLLRAFPDHTLHDRASTSLGGPVPNLAAWTAMDVGTMDIQPPSIYNRHPLVSEPIYAQYRTTNQPQDPEWTHAAWRNALRNRAAEYAVLVLCLPPRHVVRRTTREQGRKAHMPGVYENIEEIWARYNDILWPGIMIPYNYYNNSNALNALTNKITRALIHGRA